jgi:TusA-related sulfurtransferase
MTDSPTEGDATVELDCLGLRCPLPIIRLANYIDEVPVGGTVAVLADDPAARSDVPAWCRMRGHDYLGEPEPGRYLVRRVR